MRAPRGEKDMGNFAVIDTETNWSNQVMSIGTVIADTGTFRPIGAKYHVLAPEYQVGGMFSGVLFPDSRIHPMVCSREEAMGDLLCWLDRQGVDSIFAYNASFDHKLMPELDRFAWFDLIRIAAYRQHNPRISASADCCSTGRLKRNYGVEPMLRLLSGDCTYCETHNALYDAMDELTIMRLLGHPLTDYVRL